MRMMMFGSVLTAAAVLSSAACVTAGLAQEADAPTPKASSIPGT